MSYILIIGATSGMAKSIAREFASKGFDLYLSGRDADSLKILADDIKTRTGRDAEAVILDVTDFASHRSVYESLNPAPAGVICAAGFLGTQEAAQRDFSVAKQIIDTNYTGPASILNIAAEKMEEAKEGFIIGISSVAGDRGRKSNYIYGSAKSAFTEYLSGLRNRLFDSGVHVMTVKPGFVNTKMTAGMDLPEKLTAQPEDVAKDIYRAWEKKKDVIYTKGIWRFIMLIIRHIPEFKFKRMSI